MEIVHVVAVADNGVIGREGGMPWHLPEDLKRFKALTMGRPMIMGRKTFTSIGRPLPGRTSIVVTRNTAFAADGIEVCHSLDDAIALAATVAEASGVSEIAVVGGADIYRQSLALCGRVELTRIHLSPDGDAAYPELAARVWRKSHVGGGRSAGGVTYDFFRYERAV